MDNFLPSKYIEQAVEQMACLPGIGKKTALRLVLDLLKRDPKEVEKFSEAFINLVNKVNQCSSCGIPSDYELCSICANPKRNARLICVVEDLRDVIAIESTEAFDGVYHVLGGIISPMDGIGPGDLNIDSLIKKTEGNQVDEIIFALSSTMEGDTTNFYLFKKISKFGVKVSTLSRGVAIGAELHYADELTLSRSILNRTPYSIG